MNNYHVRSKRLTIYELICIYIISECEVLHFNHILRALTPSIHALICSFLCTHCIDRFENWSRKFRIILYFIHYQAIHNFSAETTGYILQGLKLQAKLSPFDICAKSGNIRLVGLLC